MSDNKKYYYMRLKEDFFDTDEMIMLESLPNGYQYANILLKLYLKSLKNNGRLVFRENIPYSPEMLSTVLHVELGTVKEALNKLEQFGLIEVLDTGVIYMNDIQLFIGKTSTEGDRKKAQRMEIEQEKKQGIIETKTNGGHLSDKRTPEIEKEIEQELELKKELKLEEETKLELANAVQKIKSLPLLLLSDLTDKNLIFLTDALKKYKFQDLVDMAEYKWSEWYSWKDREKMFTVNTLFSDKNLKPYMDDFNKQSKKREKQPNWDKQEVQKASDEAKAAAAAMMEELSGEQE